MPKTEESVFAIPTYQCPECLYQYGINRDRWFCKRSAAQKQRDPVNAEQPDSEFVAVSCGNQHCGQYSVIKIIRIPRVKVPSARVDLE